MLLKNKELFDKWNRNLLNYCHWKSNEHLKEGLEGETDLDVLLAKSDKILGCKILNEIGFVKFNSQYGSRYPNVEDWIGLDSDTGRLIHLHLHFAIVTGHTGMKEYELAWTEEALQTRVQDNETGVFIMNPNLELVTLYTRLILKTKRSWLSDAHKGNYIMDQHFQKEIDFIKKNVDWQKVKDISFRYYGDKSLAFIEIVRERELDSRLFLKLYSLVMNVMHDYSRYQGLSLFLRRIYYYIIVNVRKELRNRLGWLLLTKKTLNSSNSFAVAFIGQDGCGKSTITLEIEKWLNWKIEARRFYLGSGDHYNSLLKRLLKKGALIKHRKVKSKDIMQKKDSPINSAKTKKNKIKYFFPSILVSMNMLAVARRAYRIVMKSEEYRKKGGIPLFDRFPQTQFEGIYDGPKIVNYYKNSGLDNAIIRWMAKREYNYISRIQSYKPKIVFKLLLPPEESINRKPFENFEAVSRKHEITKQLRFDHSTVIVVDATQNYNREIIFIKNQIWNEILRYQS